LTDTIKIVLREKEQEGDLPIVVIVDFTLVVGMDSSAAHAIAKLKKIMHRLFHVEISIFVTGSDRGGFPCEYALSEALSANEAGGKSARGKEAEEEIDLYDLQMAQSPPGLRRESSSQRASQRGSISVTPNTKTAMASRLLNVKTDGRVCESLDDALKFAEDILIARVDPRLQNFSLTDPSFRAEDDTDAINLTVDEERHRAKCYLKDLLEYFPDERTNECDFLSTSVDLIVSMMVREEYKQDNILWEQGAESGSLKIIVSGDLVSVIEETGASEPVARGNVVGELGLVHGTKRLTTLMCSSPKAVLYSLDTESWNRLKKDHPKVASLIDEVVIRYLAHRVQHVANRYFHTTLPV